MSVISHELKTPVALIKGYVSTLRREDASWERSIVDDSLAVIEDEADRLTELIENLLDASRLQAAPQDQPLRRGSGCPGRTHGRTVRTQTQHHKIVVDFPPGFPIVLADESRLEQVFANLISNAIKYSRRAAKFVSPAGAPGSDHRVRERSGAGHRPR